MEGVHVRARTTCCNFSYFEASILVVDGQAKRLIDFEPSYMLSRGHSPVPMESRRLTYLRLFRCRFRAYLYLNSLPIAITFICLFLCLSCPPMAVWCTSRERAKMCWLKVYLFYLNWGAKLLVLSLLTKLRRTQVVWWLHFYRLKLGAYINHI